MLVLISLCAPLGNSATTPGGKWTVLIYLDADNNLEASGMANMREMESIGPAPGVRVLVQMDRVAGHDTTDGDWQDTRRYEIVKGTGDADALASPVLEKMGEVDMSAPASLSDFLEWGVARAPAEHYFVILWDHGGGWSGALSDDTTPDGPTMSLADIHQALQTARTASHVPRWDVLDFDACLMGAAETSNAVHDDASLLIASEELVPGQGLPYATLLTTLDTRPDITPRALSAELLPAYTARYAGTPEIAADPDAVLSVMDLQKGPAFQSALDEFKTRLAAGAQAAWPEIVSTARASEHFRNPDLRTSEAIDALDYADHLRNTTTDPALKAAANALLDASHEFVLGATTSPNHPHARGVAMHLKTPGGGDSATSEVAPGAPPIQPAVDAGNDPSNAIATAAASDASSPTFSDVALEGPEAFSPSAPLRLRASSTDAHLVTMDAVVLQAMPGGEGAAILQYVSPVAQTPMAGGSQAQFSWDGNATTLSNGADAQIVPSYQKAGGTFVVEGVYKAAGEARAINASLDFDAQGKLLRAWDDDSEASEIEPALGDSFAPTFLVVHQAGNDSLFQGGALTAKAAGRAAWTLTRSSVPPGPYSVAVYAEDLSGNAAISDLLHAQFTHGIPATTPHGTDTSNVTDASGATPPITKTAPTPGLGTMGMVISASAATLLARRGRRGGEP